MIVRCLRHRAPVLWLLLPFMGGVVLGRFMPAVLNVGWWLGGAVLAGALAYWQRERGARCIPWLLLSLILSGASSFQLHRKPIPDWSRLPPREATIVCEVLQVYQSRGDKPGFSGIVRILSANDPRRELEGRRAHASLRLSDPMHRPERGATFSAMGVISKIPESCPVGSFEGYLVASGVDFQVKRGLVIAETKPPGLYARVRNALGAQFRKHLQRGIERHRDVEGIYAGMVLGQANAMTDEQRILFSRSGTMHLFSVGGLHVGVVALAMHTLLGLGRAGPRCRSATVVALLWLYVDLTGGSPAAMRAFWIALLIEAGLAFDRPANSLSTLATAAFLSVLANPLHVFSASFQFSYAIAASILLLGIPLADTLSRRAAPFQRIPPALWKRHHTAVDFLVGSSRVDLQACKLEYSIVSPK